MTISDTNSSRLGRLPADQRDERRDAILRATLDELGERGYAGMTMARVAARAKASKETLYAWFGDRRGLLAALIEANAHNSFAVVDGALSGGLGDRTLAVLNDSAASGVTEVRATLVRLAEELLKLLTSDASLALNRAAMGDPDLADVLAASGRGRTGTRVADYLRAASEAGLLAVDDPADAFSTYYGLVVRDTQIACLLGAPPPRAAAVAARAEAAVDAFLALFASPPRT